mgnify:CR=1 FL=1
MKRIVLGSRGSALALWQSEYVAAALRVIHPGLDVQIEVFSTRGDRELDRPLPELGGKGLFTAELERALADGDIHLAVHSLKDLPTEDPEGLAVLAVPPRADPRDALLVRGDHLLALAEKLQSFPESYEPQDPFVALPPGAVVGTSSLRRAAQLLRARPDVVIKDVRGNVPTRVGKLDGGEYDGLMLACAGLDRLELADRIHRRLGVPWLGAAGQGALALQGLFTNDALRELILPLDDRGSHLEVVAERTVLSLLGGGCSLPLGVSASVNHSRLQLRARLLSPDGTRIAEANRDGEATGRGAPRLATMLVRDLMEGGAQQILEDLQDEAV